MKQKIIGYWNSGATRYNRGIEPFLRSETGTKGWKTLFSEHLGTKPLNILDVGTGPGSISVLLAGMGHEVTAVDLSEQMLNLAQKNADACGVKVDLRKGDAEDLPFEDNTFDAVVNRWVLWTVTNPTAALNEWNRVLKPGGRLCIVDGNWYSGKKTMIQKAWKQGTRVYSSITELRNAWKADCDPNMIHGLWSTHADRPIDDILLFQKTGLLDVKVYMDVNERVMTRGDYFRQGHWGPTFLVTGIKP
ncbi:MAG TPA: class I SAM-dependent methyltransferase [Methanospirillum sp.]|nr:class I SAM-dependent methyltransferase [Methanospirillum sp.]